MYRRGFFIGRLLVVNRILCGGVLIRLSAARGIRELRFFPARREMIFSLFFRGVCISVLQLGG